MEFFGPVLQAYDDACRTVMSKFKTALPEGHSAARIRYSTRGGRRVKSETLRDTLGDEAIGYVQVDFQGHPTGYNQLDACEAIVATHTHCRLELEVQEAGGRWQALSFANFKPNERTRSGISTGVRQLKDETFVRASDPHYDAKLFPHLHPFGTGSVSSELGSGSPQKLCRNRLVALESGFRRSPQWIFWQLDRSIKSALFFRNRRSRAQLSSHAAAADGFSRAFGTIVPSSIPDSTAWWRRHARELDAITDDAEAGLMNMMVTFTHNNQCAEMLAAVRRGPFALPTNLERIEHLLRRKPANASRKDFEKFGCEHVINFQQRMHDNKMWFLKRDSPSPLGIVQNYWDRTEAQQRG